MQNLSAALKRRPSQPHSPPLERTHLRNLAPVLLPRLDHIHQEISFGFIGLSGQTASPGGSLLTCDKNGAVLQGEQIHQGLRLDPRRRLAIAGHGIF